MVEGLGLMESGNVRLQHAEADMILPYRSAVQCRQVHVPAVVYLAILGANPPATIPRKPLARKKL